MECNIEWKKWRMLKVERSIGVRVSMEVIEN